MFMGLGRLIGRGNDMQCTHLVKYDGRSVELSGLSFQGFQLGNLVVEPKLLQTVSHTLMLLDASQYYFCQAVKNAPNEESRNRYYELMMQDKVRVQDIFMGLSALIINPQSRQLEDVLIKMLLQNHDRALKVEQEEQENKIEIPKENVERDSPNTIEIGTNSLKDRISDLEKSYSDSPNSNKFRKLKAQTTSKFDYMGMHRLLTEKFSLEDLETLCLKYRNRYPQMDYDNIRGSIKDAKATNLILFLEKRDRLADFYDFLTDYLASRDEE